MKDFFLKMLRDNNFSKAEGMTWLVFMQDMMLLKDIYKLGRPKRIIVDQVSDVIVRIANDPELSTRRFSAITGISHASVFRILKKEGLRPYHFTPVQNWLPTDHPRRMEFAQFIMDRTNANNNFVSNILFRYEATFTRRGVFNWSNCHIRDNENPSSIKEARF